MCENSGQFSRTTAHYLSSALSPIDMPLDGGPFFSAAAILLPLLVDNFRFRRVNAAKEKAN